MEDVRYDAAFLREDVLKVLVSGELDVYTAPAYREYLLGQLVEGVRFHVLLDMRGVSYFDSTAVGSTVRVMKELHARGARMVVWGSEHVWNVLKITGVCRLIPLVDSDEAALEVLDGLGAPMPDGEVG